MSENNSKPEAELLERIMELEGELEVRGSPSFASCGILAEATISASTGIIRAQGRAATDLASDCRGYPPTDPRNEG